MTQHKKIIEAELLQNIQLSINPRDLEEYQQLVAIYKAGEISPENYERLILLSDLHEIAHAKRMENIITLAKLRNTPLEELLSELGIPTNTNIN